MATKKLYIDGTTAVMAIMTEGSNVNSVLTNPISNLSNVYFHSDLAYLQILGTVTTNSISFGYLARGSYSWSTGGSKCCFIMLEALYGNGIMDSVVRRYRDEYITDKNKRGYYKLAEVLVPLMREYSLAKLLVRLTFASPLVHYAKWYYGYNSWGWVFTPIKNIWMKIFNILGKDTEFIRENGEII